MTLPRTTRSGSVPCRYAPLALGRYALLALGVLALVMTPLDARAQSVTGFGGPVFRVESDGVTNADSTADRHPGGVPTSTINGSDCTAGLEYIFTLTTDGVSTDNLVAWAGPPPVAGQLNCTAAAPRGAGGVAPTCWPVTPGPILQGSGTTDAGATAATFAVKMQDIIKYAGTEITPLATYAPAPVGICSAQKLPAATSLALYFFFVDPYGNATGEAAEYPVTVDTRAAPVGEGFSVNQDLDRELTVTVSASDNDTTSYNVYCDPPPGSETAANQFTDASADSSTPQCIEVASPANQEGGALVPALDGAADGATDGATDGASPLDATTDSQAPDGSGAADATVEDAAGAVADAAVEGGSVPLNPYDGGVSTCRASCSADSVLQSGGGTLTWTLIPTTNEAGATTYVEAGVITGGKPTVGIPQKNLCGTVTTANPTLQLTGLVDQDYYTIAVAAVDNAGNIGPLSVLCSQPREVSDFWANYVGAGGQAGGGCSTAVPQDERGLPAGTTGLGLLTLAAIVTLARKRRRD